MAMMKRKRTKTDRVAAEKAALRNELELLAIGANGHSNVEDDPANGCFLFSTVGCKAFAQWLEAIRYRWEIGMGEGDDTMATAHLLRPYNLHHFEGLDSATEFLYEHGARAGGKWNA